MTRREDRLSAKQELLSYPEFYRLVGSLARRPQTLLPDYAKALDEGGWAPGGSGIRVSGGNPSDATVAALNGREQKQRRDDARRAIGWMKQAEVALIHAEEALRGEEVEQPTRLHDRATISAPDFYRRSHPRHDRPVKECPYCEHERRERELRR